MKKADSRDSDIISDPKLRPIKLPPKSEQGTPRPVVARTRKRDWKGSVIVAANVIVIIGGIVVMLMWFPSYQLALMFWPAVTQADVEAQPDHYNGDYSGRRAAGDIPRLTGLRQLEDGTYDDSVYLTVETDNLIPLSFYKLKDTSINRYFESTGYTRSRSGNRSRSVYASYTGTEAMYYGQYCVLELEDKSYIGAYVDCSYNTALGKVQLPIGQVVLADSVEADLLTEASLTYPIPTDRLLMMHSDGSYEKIKFLDHGIRILSVVLVPAVVFGGWMVLAVIRKKKRSG